jgi:uncharacterized membrane protein
MADAKVPRMALRHEFLLLAKQRHRREDRVADKITAFSGSMQFVYVHIVWFTAWIVLNVTIVRFDPYPFGLLTLIVSLEAIFLSTFVLLSQNREATRSDLRSEIDFETNVLSEVCPEAGTGPGRTCSGPPALAARSTSHSVMCPLQVSSRRRATS